MGARCHKAKGEGESRMAPERAGSLEQELVDRGGAAVPPERSGDHHIPGCPPDAVGGGGSSSLPAWPPIPASLPALPAPQTVP